MKQTLKTLSQYCKGANGKVITILEGIPDDHLKKDMQTYFKSIFKTFIHMTTPDINWFVRLQGVFPESILSESQFLHTAVADLEAEIKIDSQAIFSIRKTADQLFVDFINELREEDFEKVINHKNRAGDEMSNKLGNILLHLFSHQTHHRGAISAMLDIQGVENDYSGLFKYL